MHYSFERGHWSATTSTTTKYYRRLSILISFQVEAPICWPGVTPLSCPCSLQSPCWREWKSKMAPPLTLLVSACQRSLCSDGLTVLITWLKRPKVGLFDPHFISVRIFYFSKVRLYVCIAERNAGTNKEGKWVKIASYKRNDEKLRFISRFPQSKTTGGKNH